MTAVEWADKHFWLSPESSNIPGQWTTAPYQVVPLNLVGNDDCEVLSWRKSARIGYTKIIIAGGAYLTVFRRRSGVTYQPTDPDRDGFVADEIDPMLRDCEAVNKAAISPDKKGAKNNQSAKHFQGAIWHFKGGTSPGNYRRLTKDFAQVDEADGFPWEVGEDGDPMGLAGTRLIGAPFPKLLIGTTPLVAGQSHIERQERQADLVMTMFVRCPHCHELHKLVWGGKDQNEGFKFTFEHGFKLVTPEKSDPVMYMCPHCTALWGFDQLEEAQAHGRWQNDDGTIWTKDGLQFYNLRDQPISTPKHIHLVLWAAYSLHDGWQNLVERFLKALKDGTPGAMRKIINTDRGELWLENNTELKDPELLVRRRDATYGQQGPDVPNWVTGLFGGIDTQDNRLEFYVWGYGPDEECALIDRRILLGSPSLISEDAIRANIFRRYLRHDGDQMEVTRWGWDCFGHHTDTVIKLSIKLGIFRVIPMFGSSTAGHPAHAMPLKARANKTYQTEVGVSTLKSQFYDRITIEPATDERRKQAIHLPRNDAICDLAVCQQLLAERQIKKIVKGRQVIVWDNEGRRNEAVDCWNYAHAALRISIDRFAFNLNPEPTPEERPAQKVSEPYDQQAATSQESLMARLGRQLGG